MWMVEQAEKEVRAEGLRLRERVAGLTSVRQRARKSQKRSCTAPNVD